MRIKIDIKSLLIGLLLGAVVFLAMGQTAGSAGKSDFGFAVERGGKALVMASNGALYSVDAESAEAELVEHRSGSYKGRALNLLQPFYRKK